MTQTRDLIKKMADFFTCEEFYENGEDARLELSPDDVRCMNEVIKACGNAISRQAMHIELEKWITYGEYKYSNATKYLYDRIDRLPSVTPKQRTGRWIKYKRNIILADEPYTSWKWGWKCSECGCGGHNVISEIEPQLEWTYCPDCGAKMVEPQESEDKCVICANNGMIDDECAYCTNHNLFKAESEEQA